MPSPSSEKDQMQHPQSAEAPPRKKDSPPRAMKPLQHDKVSAFLDELIKFLNSYSTKSIDADEGRSHFHHRLKYNFLSLANTAERKKSGGDGPSMSNIWITGYPADLNNQNSDSPKKHFSYPRPILQFGQRDNELIFPIRLGKMLTDEEIQDLNQVEDINPNPRDRTEEATYQPTKLFNSETVVLVSPKFFLTPINEVFSVNVEHYSHYEGKNNSKGLVIAARTPDESKFSKRAVAPFAGGPIVFRDNEGNDAFCKINKCVKMNNLSAEEKNELDGKLDQKLNQGRSTQIFMFSPVAKWGVLADKEEIGGGPGYYEAMWKNEEANPWGRGTKSADRAYSSEIYAGHLTPSKITGSLKNVHYNRHRDELRELARQLEGKSAELYGALRMEAIQGTAVGLIPRFVNDFNSEVGYNSLSGCSKEYFDDLVQSLLKAGEAQMDSLIRTLKSYDDAVEVGDWFKPETRAALGLDKWAEEYKAAPQKREAFQDFFITSDWFQPEHQEQLTNQAISEGLIDPISLDLISKPVFPKGLDGNGRAKNTPFEKANLEAWISKRGAIHPLTREAINPELTATPEESEGFFHKMRNFLTQAENSILEEHKTTFSAMKLKLDKYFSEKSKSHELAEEEKHQTQNPTTNFENTTADLNNDLTPPEQGPSADLAPKDHCQETPSIPVNGSAFFKPQHTHRETPKAAAEPEKNTAEQQKVKAAAEQEKNKAIQRKAAAAAEARAKQEAKAKAKAQLEAQQRQEKLRKKEAAKLQVLGIERDITETIWNNTGIDFDFDLVTTKDGKQIRLPKHANTMYSLIQTEQNKPSDQQDFMKCLAEIQQVANTALRNETPFTFMARSGKTRLFYQRHASSSAEAAEHEAPSEKTPGSGPK